MTDLALTTCFNHCRYSYFFETLEGLSSQDDPKAPSALKYMLLCKIMLNLTDDINAIIEGKMAQKYPGRDIEAMKAISKAHEERSLEKFEIALKDYKGGKLIICTVPCGSCD